jgi:uncharacterized membrane protein YoaK (UPF0700 family)
MQWYPLTTKQSALLIIVFVIGYGFAEVQHFFVPDAVRPFTYIIAVLLLLLAFFAYVRPADPASLARFLAVLLGAIVAVIIVVEDFLIRQNYSWRVAIVLGGAVLCPLVAGWLYRMAVKKPVL